MKRNKLICLLLILGFIVFLVGCTQKTNIFGWLYPGKNNNANVNSLIQSGNIAIQSGNYQGALGYFSSAMSQYPASCQARWGYVRAYVLINNASCLYMLSQFIGNQNMQNSFKTVWYAQNFGNVVNTIINTLDGPYSIIKNQGDGSIPYNDVEVNLNVSIAYYFSSLAILGDSSHDAANKVNGGNFFDQNDLLAMQTGQNIPQFNVSVFTQQLSQFNIAGTLSAGFSGTPAQIQQGMLTFLSNTFAMGSTVLNLFAICGNVINNLNECTYCANNVLSAIPQNNGQTNTLVKNMNNQINSLQQKINNLNNQVTINAGLLNADQETNVGYFAFASSYKNYSTVNNTWFHYYPVGYAPSSLVAQVEGFPGNGLITVTNVINYGMSYTNQVKHMQLQ